MARVADTFVAECFWPGVSAADVDALDGRVREVVERIRPVSYLGSLLVPEDEVVLCQFEGPAAVVREAAERAGVPFERIVAARLSAG